MLKTTFY